MTALDREHAQPVVDRIGAALDRLLCPEVHDAVARETRRRLRLIERDRFPRVAANALMTLADEVEWLADTAEARRARSLEQPREGR